MNQSTPDIEHAEPLKGTLLRGCAIVFVTELLIMLGWSFNPHPEFRWTNAVFDASVLTLVVAIFVHRWVVAPRDAQLADVLVQLRRAHETADRLAQIDPLTGLLNRRSFLERFEQAWARSERSAADVSFLLIDVDRFKEINDTHGHLAGDEVLKSISLVLQRQARPYDEICRYGGDEFCILSPDTSPEDAVALAQRLHRAVADEQVICCCYSLSAKISIGVASRSAQTPTIDSLIDAADCALLSVKQDGRNGVRAAVAVESSRAESACRS